MSFLKMENSFVGIQAQNHLLENIKRKKNCNAPEMNKTLAYCEQL